MTRAPEAVLRVVHLEESAADAERTRRELERYGYALEVTVVHDEAGFRDALVGTPADIVLADFRLPDVDARRALAVARELVPTTPVVIVSGALGEELAVDAMRWGATDYVRKDRLDRLAPVVRRALDEAEERRQRLQAEAALRASEERFRRLVEHAPDIIARFDRNLRHLYVNPAMEQITGRPLEASLGRTNRELGVPEHLADQWEQALRSVFETGRAATIEFQLPVPGGQDRHYDSRIVPEVDESGGVESVLGITRDVTDRHRTEEQLRQTVEQLRTIEEERRRVLQSLVDAQEQERARIAADIHDDSIQVMVAASLRLEAFAQQVDEDARPALAKLTCAVQRAVTQLRRLLFELRPPELDREGLGPAIRSALETTWEEDGPRWEVVDRLGAEPSFELRVILYRIVQEAVANVRRHARASNVQVLLEDDGTGCRLRVRDDGTGFDQSALAGAAPGHLGVVSMRERAELAGGWLQITSSPGDGTTVEAWIPAGRREPSDRGAS